MRTFLFVLSSALLSPASAGRAFSAPSTTAASSWGLSIPRGGSDSSYAAQLDRVKAQILTSTANQIETLRRQVMDEGTVVENFGSQADDLCDGALADFGAAAPESKDASSAAAYDQTLQQLEAALDAPLHVLYMKQLGYLREAALLRYRGDSKRDYEAMVQTDAQFVQAAEAATREGSDWDWSQERSFLQAVMNLTADSARKAADVQMDAAKQQQTAMSFLQSQQQMIQQLQQQLYGQSSPWNVGVAYRIPDTNFNLQGSYQQGRANVQLSCVPDEYAPFLGPNGFTNGVGPGNLGLSLNLSI